MCQILDRRQMRAVLPGAISLERRDRIILSRPSHEAAQKPCHRHTDAQHGPRTHLTFQCPHTHSVLQCQSRPQSLPSRCRRRNARTTDAVQAKPAPKPAPSLLSRVLLHHSQGTCVRHAHSIRSSSVVPARHALAIKNLSHHYHCGTSADGKVACPSHVAPDPLPSSGPHFDSPACAPLVMCAH